VSRKQQQGGGGGEEEQEKRKKMKRQGSCTAPFSADASAAGADTADSPSGCSSSALGASSSAGRLRETGESAAVVVVTFDAAPRSQIANYD
jgi:hypothetical protein